MMITEEEITCYRVDYKSYQLQEGPSPFLSSSHNIQNTDLETILLKEGLLSQNCHIMNNSTNPSW